MKYLGIKQANLDPCQNAEVMQKEEIRATLKTNLVNLTLDEINQHGHVICGKK